MLAPGDLVKVEGELRLFVAQRVILAQRVAFPIGGHDDAAQVRMALDVNAEHIEQLALRPVGHVEDAFHRGQRGVVAIQWHPQAQAQVVLVRVQPVDDVETRRLLRPVIRSGQLA